MKTRKYIMGNMLSLAAFCLLLLTAGGVKAQTQTIISHNFLSNCNPPAGWQVVNVDGGCTWRCSGGIIQNNHSSQSCSGAADDWLIMPLADYSLYVNVRLSIS